MVHAPSVGSAVGNQRGRSKISIHQILFKSLVSGPTTHFIAEARAESFFPSRRFFGDARVPIVIKHEDYMLGIIIDLSEKPSLSDLRCGASFLRNYGNAKIIYLSYEISSPQVLDERSLHCSVGSVL